MINTGRDLITKILQVAGVLAEGQPLDFADGNVALDSVNAILDGWNAEDQMIYSTPFYTFTLVPNLAPHTIGPVGSGATFTGPFGRPIKIINASLVQQIDTNPPVNNPIMIRDADWWATQRIQGLTTTFPTDLYYEPDMPIGKIYFWPVPTVAYEVQLQLMTLLAQLTLNTPIVVPPAYLNALIYTGAEEIGPTVFGKPENATVIRLAAKYRGKVFLPNTQMPPRIQTFDSGMRSASDTRSTFNWRNGGVV